jgi:hypothetical protein
MAAWETRFGLGRTSIGGSRMSVRSRAGRLLRLAATAAVVASLVSSCGPSFGFVVVRKADGFYLAATSCPLYRLGQVRVANWSAEEFARTSDSWVSGADTTAGAEIPASGLLLGGDSDGFTVTEPAEVSLGTDSVIEVQVQLEDGRSTAGAYSLDLGVGEFRAVDGGVGDWNDAVRDSPCLAP